MLKGTMYVMSDINLAIQASMNSKVLYIGELNQNLPPSFIECSVLLPPYEALNAEIDGDMQMYDSIYNQYLTFSYQCFGMFATILVALKNGINITLYIEGGNELSHGKYILNYIQNTFGITVGNEVIPFSYNPLLNWQTASILYTYMDGFISEDEFLMYTPDLNIISALELNHPFIHPIQKLATKFGLSGDHNTIILWLNKYIYMTKNYGNIIPGPMINIEKDE